MSRDLRLEIFIPFLCLLICFTHPLFLICIFQTFGKGGVDVHLFLDLHV